MANNVKVAVARRNAMIDNCLGNANSGKLRIYDSTGTGQPATADTAVTTQQLLAELTMNATAFAAASSGSATANAITDDTSADNTGTATWFRLLKSDGTTPILDGSVGTSGCDLNLSTTSIVTGVDVSVTSFVVSMS